MRTNQSTMMGPVIKTLLTMMAPDLALQYSGRLSGAAYVLKRERSESQTQTE